MLLVSSFTPVCVDETDTANDVSVVAFWRSVMVVVEFRVFAVTLTARLEKTPANLTGVAVKASVVPPENAGIHPAIGP